MEITLKFLNDVEDSVFIISVLDDKVDSEVPKRVCLQGN